MTHLTEGPYFDDLSVGDVVNDGDPLVSITPAPAR